MATRATRESIADAAEFIFGEQGFPAASLRQITDKAGANLAAVNYYFRSKEDLYREVLFRRLRAVNAERLTLLTQAEQLAGDHPVPLRAVFDTLIRPWLPRAGAPAAAGFPSLRLVSRELMEPQPFLQAELAREFEPLTARYTQALGQCLPGVPPAELLWRLQFSLGALHAAAVRWPELQRLAAGPEAAPGREDLVRRLVDWCAAGLAAPRITA